LVIVPEAVHECLLAKLLAPAVEGAYLKYEAFEDLRDPNEFMKISNGGYFVEWDCGADLSVNTIEAQWQVIGNAAIEASA
jgi:hypothetical protein